MAPSPRWYIRIQHDGRVDPLKPLNPRFHPLAQPGNKYGGIIGLLNKTPYGFRVPLIVVTAMGIMYLGRRELQKNGARSVWNVQLPYHAEPVVNCEWDWRYRTQFQAEHFGHVYKAIHNDRLKKAGLLDDQGNFIGELPEYVKPGAPIPAIPQHPEDQSWVRYVLSVDRGIKEGWLPANFHHHNPDDYFWKLEELKEKGDEDGALELMMPFLLLGWKSMSPDASDYPEVVAENGVPGIELWFKPTKTQLERVEKKYLKEKCNVDVF